MNNKINSPTFFYIIAKSALKQIRLSAKDRTRLESMLFSRKDWCISRQRTYGVNIPNKKDILDVWFDSGSSFMMYDTPVDLYIEGSDQHRGYFQASVILAGLIDHIPTKRILTHGFIIDEYKNKLSKSKGNFKSLDELYERYNPDVLRLWILLSDYKNDVIFSEEGFENSAKQYFKIRNFMRYLLNNLYILNYNEELVVDIVKDKINTLEKNIHDDVEEFNINKALRNFINFINSYSSGLSEQLKNDFYESKLDSKFRFDVENEFYFVFIKLNKLLFSFLPFLSVELDESLKK